MCAAAQTVGEQYAAQVADGYFGRNMDIAFIASTAPNGITVLRLATALDARSPSPMAADVNADDHLCVACEQRFR